jgi:integrase
MSVTTTAAPETFRAYASSWLQRRARSLHGRSLPTYEWVLSRHVLPDLGDVGIHCITRRTCCTIFDDLGRRGLGPRTVRLAVSVVTAILNDAVDAEVLLTNPAHRLIRRYPEPRDEAPYYTEAQLRQFLSAAAEHTPTLHALFAIMGKAGLRVGEARGLQSSDFDLTGRVIRVQRQIQKTGEEDLTKGKRSRAVPVVKSLLPILEPLCARERWVFPEVTTVTGYRRIWKATKRICTAARLPIVSPKAMRHTAASVLLSAGYPLAAVQKMLGHADPRTTQRYAMHLPMAWSPVLDEK